MSDEWNKGFISTGPQHSHEARQGRFARQQVQRRERDAAAQAASEREQRFQDQMIREAIRTASQPVLAGGGRIFGNSASRRGGNRVGLAGLALTAMVLLVVLFGTGNGTRMMPVKAVPATPRLPPPELNARAEPAADSLPKLPVAVAPERPAAGPPMPPIDRFGLRRFELVRGDSLELVVSWQSPDGARRAAAMNAFIVTRNAGQRRTPILEAWSVFPGESTIPLALPAGIVPGKYELETVWTLGGEAREARTQFTLAERAVVSNAAAAPPPSQAPDHPVVASVVASPPPVAEPDPEPPKAQAPAVDRVPPVAVVPPPARPRATAGDQLYTGG